MDTIAAVIPAGLVNLPAPTRAEVLTGVDAYIEALQISIANDYTRRGYTQSPPVISAKIGNRYVKIIESRTFNGHTSSSVQGFIDLTNGDILKAASWKAPAKHARGNVCSPDCIRANFNLTSEGNVPYLK